MSYVPNSVDVFTAAYSGALAGMGISDRVPTDQNASSYASLAVIAGAFAQAFDTVWGSATPNQLDLDSILELSEAAWQDRAPITSAVTTNPASWLHLSRVILAMVTAGEGYYAGQGITPPPAGGGGGSSLNAATVTIL